MGMDQTTPLDPEGRYLPLDEAGVLQLAEVMLPREHLQQQSCVIKPGFFVLESL